MPTDTRSPRLAQATQLGPHAHRQAGFVVAGRQFGLVLGRGQTWRHRTRLLSLFPPTLRAVPRLGRTTSVRSGAATRTPVIRELARRATSVAPVVEIPPRTLAPGPIVEAAPRTLLASPIIKGAARTLILAAIPAEFTGSAILASIIEVPTWPALVGEPTSRAPACRPIIAVRAWWATLTVRRPAAWPRRAATRPLATGWRSGPGTSWIARVPTTLARLPALVAVPPLTALTAPLAESVIAVAGRTVTTAGLIAVPAAARPGRATSAAPITWSATGNCRCDHLGSHSSRTHRTRARTRSPSSHSRPERPDESGRPLPPRRPSSRERSSRPRSSRPRSSRGCLPGSHGSILPVLLRWWCTVVQWLWWGHGSPRGPKPPRGVVMSGSVLVSRRFPPAVQSALKA